MVFFWGGGELTLQVEGRSGELKVDALVRRRRRGVVALSQERQSLPSSGHEAFLRLGVRHRLGLHFELADLVAEDDDVVDLGHAPLEVDVLIDGEGLDARERPLDGRARSRPRREQESPPSVDEVGGGGVGHPALGLQNGDALVDHRPQAGAEVVVSPGAALREGLAEARLGVLDGARRLERAATREGARAPPWDRSKVGAAAAAIGVGGESAGAEPERHRRRLSQGSVGSE